MVILALIPLLAALIGYLGGTRTLRRYAFPVGYLILAVPMPFVERWVAPLQRLAVTLSTALARGLGVPASNKGSQIILSRDRLVVGAPCSGLYSLIALLALAVLMAYIVEGRWWARALLAVLAVPAALAANVGRVLALLLIAERWGGDVALGLWHTWAGPFFFGTAVALLFAASRWLRCSRFRADI